LEAAECVEAKLKQDCGEKNVERVSSGASQALLEFTPPSEQTAEDLRSVIDRYLRGHAQFKHATFVVDVLAASGDFATDKEKLLARNRWRQVQQLALAVPEEPAPQDLPARGRRYCPIDFVRPATIGHQARNVRKRRVSQSVQVRAKYGLVQRQRFYERQMELLAGEGPLAPPPLLDDRWLAGQKAEGQMAWDFQQIAARGNCRFGEDAQASDVTQDDVREGSRDRLRRLNGKIAVIYMDGNSFGRIQQASCADVDSQGAWDHHVQTLRRSVLKVLWDEANMRNDLLGHRWRCRWPEDRKRGYPEQILTRLETLLWGGDDLLWVVPAWKGWRVLSLFFQEARKFEPWKLSDGREVRLTHGAGVVFCHANTPIHRVTRLAEHQLAELAKTVNRVHGDRYERYQDALAYCVLESFDQLGQDLPRARQGHLPQGCSLQDVVITADELECLTRDVLWCIERFPRSQLYRVLRLLQAGDREAAERWIRRAVRDELRGTAGEGQWKEHAVLKNFWAEPWEAGAAKKLARWLHAAELWDYLPQDELHEFAGHYAAT
jgi:hypothetical protein